MNYPSQGGTSNAPPSSADQNRKIFLGGLNYHTTDENLRKFCSRFGSFTDCLVMRTSDGKSRGFGFVTYETEESVEDFMRARPHTIDGRQIDPKRAMPREDQNRSEAHLTVKKLFVAGIREGIDENNLREYFSRFGNVVEVLPMRERDGRHRGFAFVTFDDYDAVDKAILTKPHSINGRTIDIKKAIPKEKMQELGYRMPHTGRGRSSGPSPDQNDYLQPPPPPPPRDEPYPNHWDDHGGMGRIGNANSNYNQMSMPSYPSQGYGSNAPNYNQPMPSAPHSSYPSSYSTNMGQSQSPSMGNYDMYNQGPPPSYGNGNSNVPPYTNSPNSMNNSGYLGGTSTTPYGSNPPSSYGSMNNPYSGPAAPLPNSNGYNDGPTPSSSHGNPNAYSPGLSTYPTNNNSSNYNHMPGSSRGGGPIRGGRGSAGYHGSNNSSNYTQRSAPYPSRGGRGGGRGRGRGQ